MTVRPKAFISMTICMLLLVGIPFFLCTNQKKPYIEKKAANHVRAGFQGKEPLETGNVMAILPAIKPETHVFKPVSITSNQGGRPCIEIAHGLREVNLTGGETYPDEVIKAQQRGADAAITLRVVDSRGQPVQDATVKGAFWNGGLKGFGFRLETDGDGLVSLQNRCVGDLNFSISKENHYDTTLRYWFFKNSYDCVKDGRWMPWNPTVEVVLKEKRNPVHLALAGGKFTFPKDEKIGFDCIAKDFVPPHGNGETADFFVTYSSNGKPWGQLEKKLTVVVPAEGGVMRLHKDTYSELQSLHEAPETGYQPETTFELVLSSGQKDTQLEQSEYIIMRSRAERDGARDTDSFIYTKITGLRFDDSNDHREGRLFLGYYTNPTRGDRNLEAAK